MSAAQSKILSGADSHQLQVLLQELTQLTTSMDELVALPLKALLALAGSDSNSPLGQVSVWPWLKEQQREAGKIGKLSQLIALLCKHEHAEDGTSCDLQVAEGLAPPVPPFFVVAVKGFCSFGEWLSAVGGFDEALSTCSDPRPPTDFERWELHRLKKDVFGLKNVGHGKWLTAYPNGIARCFDNKHGSWEAWQLLSREPWGDRKCNIALRSCHGRFLCQEPLWFHAQNPEYQGSASHRQHHSILHVVADRPRPTEWEAFSLTDGEGNSLPDWIWHEIKKATRRV